VNALGALADDARVGKVHEPRTFRSYATTEGIGQTGANTWQAAGRTGAGTKVAVVDLGFTGLAAQQAAGNLPATTNQSFCGNGGPGTLDGVTNHGTGVAEIVHQMAPGAQMYLVCFDQDADLSGVVAYLQGQGVTIVNASWGNPFSDGATGPVAPTRPPERSRREGPQGNCGQLQQETTAAVTTPSKASTQTTTAQSSSSARALRSSVRIRRRSSTSRCSRVRSLTSD
jgi:hypothetical protein